MDRRPDSNTTSDAAAPQRTDAVRQPTDMPSVGWLSIFKRSLREFKHDDITGS